MTDDEVYAAIRAIPAIRAMAAMGNDAGTAAALSATLPPGVVEARLKPVDILRVLGPADGNRALKAIERMATATYPDAAPDDPRVEQAEIVGRVLQVLNTDPDGLDFSSPNVRAMLDQLGAAGTARGGLDPAVVARLKAVAERPAVVTHEQVSRAMLRDRPGGRIPPPAA
jgi:hypothetical protein